MYWPGGCSARGCARGYSAVWRPVNSIFTWILNLFVEYDKMIIELFVANLMLSVFVVAWGRGGGLGY